MINCAVPDDGTIVVKPSGGVLAPRGMEGSKAPLTVEFMSQTHGHFSAVVGLDVSGQAPTPSIHVSAQAVQHSLKACRVSTQKMSKIFIPSA